ncbi:MAG: LysM peptidoglycan-binding domain-containing protein [Anaerolineae bacterium]|nr:LysM peptidoglycan-binding domain-containing protein [Anaerolineae bacterium]
MPIVPGSATHAAGKPLGAWRLALPALGLALLLLLAAACQDQPPTPTPRLPTPEPVASPTPTVTLPVIALVTASPGPSATASPTPCVVPLGWLPWTIDPGETLSAIAQRYAMTAAEIQAANCLPSADEIVVGQTIYVPYYVTPTPTPCFPNPNWVPYTVQVGDSWYRLAALYGYSVAELQAGTCAAGEMLYAGQIIYVPYLIPAPPPPQPGPTSEFVYGRTPPAPPPGERILGRVPAPGIPSVSGACPVPDWLVYDDEADSSAQYDITSRLWLTVTHPNYWAVDGAACLFEDVELTVRASPQTAAPVAYGLACRVTSDRPVSYYAFLVNQEGKYAIVQVQNYYARYLVDWTPEEQIETGAGVFNRLSITCDGESLSFRVNGKEVPGGHGVGSSEGDIGLIVVTPGGEPATVVFDASRARKPTER